MLSTRNRGLNPQEPNKKPRNEGLGLGLGFGLSISGLHSPDAEHRVARDTSDETTRGVELTHAHTRHISFQSTL